MSSTSDALPAERAALPGVSAGLESGVMYEGGIATLEVLPLDVPVEMTRFCDRCECEQRFVVDRECMYGRVGTCAGCGEEKLIPFTRATSEAA